MSIVVEKYSAAHLDDCVSMLAQAFVTSPLHLSAFGAGRLDQNRTFFRIGLRNMYTGPAFVALRDGAVCGYSILMPHPIVFPHRRRFPTRRRHCSNRWAMRSASHPVVRPMVPSRSR